MMSRHPMQLLARRGINLSSKVLNLQTAVILVLLVVVLDQIVEDLCCCESVLAKWPVCVVDHFLTLVEQRLSHLHQQLPWDEALSVAHFAGRLVLNRRQVMGMVVIDRQVGLLAAPLGSQSFDALLVSNHLNHVFLGFVLWNELVMVFVAQAVQALVLVLEVRSLPGEVGCSGARLEVLDLDLVWLSLVG